MNNSHIYHSILVKFGKHILTKLIIIYIFLLSFLNASYDLCGTPIYSILKSFSFTLNILIKIPSNSYWLLRLHYFL